LPRASTSISRGSDATAELDRRPWHDLKPRLAESFVEAGKDVAAVPFRADFVFAAHVQNVSLEQIIDASNYHGCRSISARIKVSVRLESIRAGPLTFSICMALVLVRADVCAAFSLTVAAQPRFCGDFAMTLFRCICAAIAAWFVVIE
jgi:hypothetical protein